MQDGFCNACLKKLFGGAKVSPVLPFSKPEYNRVHMEQESRISISGMQTKHSLKRVGKKLELTDRDGEFLLKPIPNGNMERPSEAPANEHVSMQIASQVYKIETAANALVFFDDGEPAYLTKRFDRTPKGKLLQEDFCQLAGKTEDSHGKNYKYDASYEDIAEIMKRHIAPYPVESEKLFKLIVFNYFINNGDAHLKNFSVIRGAADDFYRLSPAYDLMDTRLHISEESDTALDLFKDGFSTESYNANAYYAKDDFLIFGLCLGMIRERVLTALDFPESKIEDVINLLNRSYLQASTRELYATHIRERVKRLRYSFISLGAMTDP